MPSIRCSSCGGLGRVEPYDGTGIPESTWPLCEPCGGTGWLAQESNARAIFRERPAWTPGRWEYTDGNVVTPGNNMLAVSGIAQPHGYVPPDDVSYANARLIAAAPDLYIALDAMLNADLYADAEGVWNFANSDTTEGERAVKMARAALAKAEGR